MDCNGVAALNELGRLKELFHKIVSAKPSYKEAWECYAKIVLIRSEGDITVLKVLTNQASVLQKAIRVLMADNSWYLEDEKRNNICQVAQNLAQIGLR